MDLCREGSDVEESLPQRQSVARLRDGTMFIPTLVHAWRSTGARGMRWSLEDDAEMWPTAAGWFCAGCGRTG